MAAAGLFGLGPLHMSVLLTTITITPLLFIPTMRRLAVLSSMGFLSTVLVTLSVAAAAVVDPHRKAIPQQVRLLLCGLPVAMDGLRADLKANQSLKNMTETPCAWPSSRRQGTRL